MNNILENINDGIITAGADGLVNYINQYATRLIGIEAEDALGKPLRDTVKMVDSKTGKPVNIPYEIVLKNNERILNRNHSVLISAGKTETHVSFDITPLPDTKDKRAGILFIIRDNSLSSAVLEETENKLNKTREELDQFIYIASHDLQEPLRMVSSYVQLLEKRYSGKLDKDADEFITYAVNGVSKMKNMLSDLLEYSRLNTRKEEFTKTDCYEIVEGIARNFRAKPEVKTEFRIENLPDITCDANQIFQLFYQLIDNAVKFNASQTRIIKISSNRTGGLWSFSVEDNGIGIEEKYTDKIFSMFQRLHKNEYPGTGIGLALCKKIVENHGGEIRVESEYGKGSTFHFTLTAGTEAEE